MAFSRCGSHCLGGFAIAAALVLLNMLVVDDPAAQVCLNNTHQVCLNNTHLDVLPPWIYAAPIPPSPLHICATPPSPVTPPLQICSPLNLPTSSSLQFCFAPPLSSHQQIQFNNASLHQELARRLCQHLGLDFERLLPPTNNSTSTFRFLGVILLISVFPLLTDAMCGLLSSCKRLCRPYCYHRRALRRHHTTC
jgi:hypothetical protein